MLGRRPLARLFCGLVSLVSAVASAPATAAPAVCPETMPGSGVFVCTVVDGDSVVNVLATSQDGGAVLADLTVNDVEHLFAQSFAIYNFDAADFVDVGLVSATADATTGTIVTQFSEVTAGAIQATATFQLTDAGGETILDEDLSILSTPPQPLTAVSGRLYVVTDFDLDETPLDDSVEATQGGRVMTQVEGAITATQTVIGDAPDAFQVAPCCALEDPLDGFLIELDGTASLVGPDDYEFAISWDRTIPAGTSFDVSLQKIVPVPEPSAPLAAAVSLVVLAATARGRRRGARILSRHRA